MEMEDFLDNLNENEFDGKTCDAEERKCKTDDECVSVRWMKPGSVLELMFVTKDVLLLRVENTLLFYNVKTQEEELLVVGRDNKDYSSPVTDDKIPLFLDGIGCVGCSDTGLLALSEREPSAKVVVCRYPNIKVLATLIDSSSSAAYKTIVFLRLEYLIGLRGYPAFDLVVWSWRTEELLFVVNTGYIQPDQCLKLHSAISGRDAYLSQTERDVMCRIQLWTVRVSYKTVLAKSTRVELANDAWVTSGCWSSGWFVFCDSSTNVYRARPGATAPEMCVKRDAGELLQRGRASAVCPSENGFFLYADNELTSFRDDKGDFIKTWSISTGFALYSLVAGENCVYAWSDEGVLLKFAENVEKQLRFYGANIKYFTFVKPTDETVATVDKTNVLRVWDVSTGELKSETKLNGIATNLCSNPVYCYVAVPFENGKVELWKTDPRANDLEEISKIILCDDELSSVHFFANGNECVVISLTTGRFYYVNIELGRTCVVVRDFRWEKRMVDVEIFESDESAIIVAVYTNEREGTTDGGGGGGNNVVVFDARFNVVAELKNTQFYYTTVFKWTGAATVFDAPHVINAAFTVVRSTRVYLTTIDIKTKTSKLKIVPLAHSLNTVNVCVRKNHCVTFGDDGAYNVYWFRDGLWVKAVTVNCSQWQTGGLMAAQIDANARNVLTLSRLGNLMCTNLESDCNSCFTRYYRTDMPTYVDYMKTGGVGSEDGPGNKKRMTWRMLANEVAIDSTERANIIREKERIAEEFEKIRKELTSLLDANEKAPDGWKLNIEEFDLNPDYSQHFRENCKIERERHEAKILDDMVQFKVQTKAILKEHWEPLCVKPKSINCLKTLYVVSNYTIKQIEDEFFTETSKLLEGERLKDSGVETSPSINTSVTLTEDSITSLNNDTPLADSEYDRLMNDKTLTGSISHKFIDAIDYLNSFEDNYTLEDMINEITLLRFTILKLKYNFNKLFDKLFTDKQNQLDNLNEYNKRLRVIESELRLACKIEPTIHSTVDYELKRYEQPEHFLRVENDYGKPYGRDTRSSGEQSLPCKTDTTDEFRFKQRALIAMMDGYLEKSWEKELRMDVPKPQCILDGKLLADYAEEDFIAVAKYEREVAAKNDKRTVYKNMLEDEQASISKHIDDTVNGLDKSAFELFQIKYKYDAAIDQERLKIFRLSKTLDDDERQKRQIELRRQSDLDVEKKIDEITETIASTEKTSIILLDTVDALRNKIVNINKRFKSEFSSKSLHNQALIVYNRRPAAVPITDDACSTLQNYYFADTITDPSGNRADRLCAKFARYLHVLEAYDNYNKYLKENKKSVVYDEQTWRKICYFRRLKIQCEFQIVACQNDATDKAELLKVLANDKKTMIKRLKTSTVNVPGIREFYYDRDTQLVIRQGYAEIKLTGHAEDFHDTILVTRSIIEELNAKIKEAGKIKMNALSNLIKLKRKNEILRRELTVLKEHKIPLFKYRHHYISTMGISPNILHYLKLTAKGMDMVGDAEKNSAEELEIIQSMYEKKNERITEILEKLAKDVMISKQKSNKLDADVDRAIRSWTELHNKMNHNKLACDCVERLANSMDHVQLEHSVKTLQRKIMILQTELEWLRSKSRSTKEPNKHKIINQQ